MRKSLNGRDQACRKLNILWRPASARLQVSLPVPLLGWELAEPHLVLTAHSLVGISWAQLVLTLCTHMYRACLFLLLLSSYMDHHSPLLCGCGGRSGHGDLLLKSLSQQSACVFSQVFDTQLAQSGQSCLPPQIGSFPVEKEIQALSSVTQEGIQAVIYLLAHFDCPYFGDRKEREWGIKSNWMHPNPGSKVWCHAKPTKFQKYHPWVSPLQGLQPLVWLWAQKMSQPVQYRLKCLCLF